jgi:hypothetical protein
MMRLVRSEHDPFRVRYLLRLLLTVAGVIAGLAFLIYGVIAEPSLTGLKFLFLIAAGWGGGAYQYAVARGLRLPHRIAWGIGGAIAGSVAFALLISLDSLSLRLVGLCLFLAVALLGQQDYRKGFIRAVRSDYENLKARRKARKEADAGERNGA